MVNLTISASTYFVNHSGFKIDENASGNVLSSSSLAEEGVKGIFGNTDALVRRHLTVLMNSMFKAEELPARIAHLDASLATMNIYYFSHFAEFKFCIDNAYKSIFKKNRSYEVSCGNHDTKQHG